MRQESIQRIKLNFHQKIEAHLKNKNKKMGNLCNKLRKTKMVTEEFKFKLFLDGF